MYWVALIFSNVRFIVKGLNCITIFRQKIQIFKILYNATFTDFTKLVIRWTMDPSLELWLLFWQKLLFLYTLYQCSSCRGCFIIFQILSPIAPRPKVRYTQSLQRMTLSQSGPPISCTKNKDLFEIFSFFCLEFNPGIPWPKDEDLNEMSLSNNSCLGKGARGHRFWLGIAHRRKQRFVASASLRLKNNKLGQR